MKKKISAAQKFPSTPHNFSNGPSLIATVNCLWTAGVAVMCAFTFLFPVSRSL